MKGNRGTGTSAKYLRSDIGVWVVRVFMCIYSVIVLYPILWAVFCSVKDNASLFDNIFALPSELHFENYVNAWTKAHISQYFLNTVVITIGSLALMMLFASMASYVIARYDFLGRRVFRFLYISGMMIPGTAGIVPLFIELSSFGMVDNRVALIARLMAAREYQKRLLLLYEALDPSAFLQALLPLRKKRMDASNRCTTLVHIANGYLYGGQPQQALAVLEDVQPPEKALEMRGLVAGNKATCFLAAGEMDRAQTAMDELRRIAADRSCKKEFVQKARHTLGYLQLCMDIARGRHADVGALQKDFESSRAPLHRLDVQYRIALALRHRGDRTGMEKSREYLLENSGGTCYGELARAL